MNTKATNDGKPYKATDGGSNAQGACHGHRASAQLSGFNFLVPIAHSSRHSRNDGSDAQKTVGKGTGTNQIPIGRSSSTSLLRSLPERHVYTPYTHESY